MTWREEREKRWKLIFADLRVGSEWGKWPK